MTTPFISRLYQHPADLDRVLALAMSRPAMRLLDYPTPADLREMLAITANHRLIRIWETSQGIFAGYALLNCEEDYVGLVFESAPEFSSTGIEDAMVAWAETAFREDYHGKADQINSSAQSLQVERARLLEKHGFVREAESAVRFSRDLSEQIPEPPLPNGFVIRPLNPGEEIAWVNLHQAAFGTQNMTLEYRQAMSAAADYNPQLDLVAEAPNGTLAAYVFGAIHPEENALTGQQIGYTDPVATHPMYQRLGLSKALLLACLRKLAQHQMKIAHLGTSSENIAMQKAAQSVGFCQAGESWQYAKFPDHPHVVGLP